MRLELLRYYGSRGLRIEKAYMQYVWDREGRRYLDLHTGHGIAFLGHNNPHIMKRLERQLHELLVCNPSFECSVQEEVLEKLSQIAPEDMDTVLFANSGAEGVEAALKIAWASTGRRRIVAFRGSFHGRTLGALSVTWGPSYRRGFPVLEDVVFLPFNSEPAIVEKFFPEDAAAVIVEPVQGEGGVFPAEREFLRAVERVAREKGALFIVDEVQSGFGRTGRLWAYQHYGVKPDVLIAGKSIGGGFPVSVVFTRRKLADVLRGGRHGSTYAANPLALAAVSAAIDVLLGDNVPLQAREKGRAFMDILSDRLRGAKSIREIRGKGLMVGVDTRFNPLPVLKCLQNRGILALRAGVTVVRFLPPYMVEQNDLEETSNVLRNCLPS